MCTNIHLKEGRFGLGGIIIIYIYIYIYIVIIYCVKNRKLIFDTHARTHTPLVRLSMTLLVLVMSSRGLLASIW